MSDTKIPKEMNKHTCDAIVISCMDFRFQKYIEQWEKDNLEEHTFDRIALGGAVYDFYSILRQVEISHKLHNIKKVVIINHENCGAYGEAGTYERHQHDLAEAERKLEALYPDLDVETYYLHMDGTFEEMSQTESRG